MSAAKFIHFKLPKNWKIAKICKIRMKNCLKIVHGTNSSSKLYTFYLRKNCKIAKIYKIKRAKNYTWHKFQQQNL